VQHKRRRPFALLTFRGQVTYDNRETAVKPESDAGSQ